MIALQLRYKTCVTPKLNLVAVNELPGMVRCGGVICGNEFIRAQKMPIRSDAVGPILPLVAHGR